MWGDHRLFIRDAGLVFLLVLVVALVVPQLVSWVEQGEALSVKVSLFLLIIPLSEVFGVYFSVALWRDKGVSIRLFLLVAGAVVLATALLELSLGGGLDEVPSFIGGLCIIFLLTGGVIAGFRRLPLLRATRGVLLPLAVAWVLVTLSYPAIAMLAFIARGVTRDIAESVFGDQAGFVGIWTGWVAGSTVVVSISALVGFLAVVLLRAVVCRVLHGLRP